MENKNITIKDWADEDKPIEKLCTIGESSLSNSELLAILIKTGQKNKSAIDIAKEILSDNSLRQLSNLSIQELNEYPGIGNHKAATIKACLEIGRRYMADQIRKGEKLDRPQNVANYFIHKYGHLPTEIFIVVALNNSNELIDYQKISKGLINETLVHPREVFHFAIRAMAAKIIILHNHPSGKNEASRADINLTQRLIETSKVIGIPIVDHIIFTLRDYLSFKNSGLM